MKTNWKEAFTEEFKIHFKDCPDELKFALAFIEDLLDEQKQEMVDRINEDKPENWDNWSIERQLGYNMAIGKSKQKLTQNYEKEI